MRIFLFSLFVLAAFSSYAQDVTPVTVPAKAVAQLEKIRKQTQVIREVGKKGSSLPAETRPILNKILVQSATDFLAITKRKAGPTKEAYYQSLDAMLARLHPLVPQLEDRQQVAEYYQDLLDIVGIDSSEGRLTTFVEGAAN